MFNDFIHIMKIIRPQDGSYFFPLHQNREDLGQLIQRFVDHQANNKSA
jgi:hypothetical protein